MDALDVFIPEIIQSATKWVEDRYGRAAGLIAFVGLLIAVPIFGLLIVLGFLMLKS